MNDKLITAVLGFRSHNGNQAARIRVKPILFSFSVFLFYPSAASAVEKVTFSVYASLIFFTRCSVAMLLYCYQDVSFYLGKQHSKSVGKNSQKGTVYNCL
jgi:hypothetical protein